MEKLIKKIFNLILKIDRTGVIRLKDTTYLSMKYYTRFNCRPNLVNPATFNEKLQWLKLYDHNPLYTKLVDKYEVRKYIKSTIGEEYLIPLLGVYDDFDEIDFEKLPNRFAIKCNHDSGSVVVCHNKKTFDVNSAKLKIIKAMKKNYYYGGREWPYKNVKPKIIVEQYLENPTQEGLIDYKFYCFNGKPKFLYVSIGLENHETASMDFFDMNFEKMLFGRSDYSHLKEVPSKPKNFEKMQEIAAILAKNIPFVRIDLYEINNQIYFSEATLYPCSGLMPFNPTEWDLKIGDLLELPYDKGDKDA